jgi:hypothetical protein
MSGKDVTKRSEDAVAEFLDKVERVPATAGRPGSGGRLIFALDATASREPTWDRASDVQAQMFLEAGRFGGLEVQLVYYRGFHECKASRWVKNPAELLRLMTGVMCRAGQTQIRRVLRHALGETRRQRVNALVFVGDCCEEDVDELGALAGELGLLGIRAFLFQEGSDPKATRAFRDIARLTGGAHCAFDRNSPSELRDLLGAVAAYASGGKDALQELQMHGSVAVKLLAGQVR